jgi:hypothetical protein
MMKKFLATAVIIVSLINSSFAQDSTKSLTISGSVDGYYRYNFSNAPDGATNNKTSFTNSQSAFALGMATIKADATALSGKVTATADLGFGTRAEEFSYYETASKSSLAMVKQLYVAYALSSNVKITAGKFATHVGYEVMDAPLNRNYSMSYMFTNGPFSHTGVKLDVTAGPIGFMAGVANFIDQTSSTTNVKTFIAQVSGGSKDGKFNIGFNATIQSRKQKMNADNNISDGSWKAAAIYLNVDPSATVGLTLRSEYVSDSKIIYYGTKNIFANTLSLNYKVGPFTLIPEIRIESANSDYFIKKDGTGSKSTATALLAAVYKF